MLNDGSIVGEAISYNIGKFKYIFIYIVNITPANDNPNEPKLYGPFNYRLEDKDILIDICRANETIPPDKLNIQGK